MPNDFLSLGIRSELNDILKEQGIKVPTPVQLQAIPTLLSGKDIVAQAQTGTGKTLAFLLPILEKINGNQTHIQALIITPTRELALQITTEVNKLAFKVNANVLAAYGGQDVERQIKKLKGSIHIVVGTPGRILDHIRRGTINLSGVRLLVLDEADQMLHMGFLPDVEDIIRQTSPKRQNMLFSATIPGSVRTLARRYMKNPVDIKIESKTITLDEIKQVVIATTDREKQDTLFKLIDEHRPYLAMIFCRTKVRAIALNEALLEKGYLSDELHGDLSQAKREQVMKRFREAKLQLLVATDVAARGLDVEGITHVYNYDIPEDADSYIHRIGRTGRAGEKGIAITFATARDSMLLQGIEKGIGMSIEVKGRIADAKEQGPKGRQVRKVDSRDKKPGKDRRRNSEHPKPQSQADKRRSTQDTKKSSQVPKKSNQTPKKSNQTQTRKRMARS